MQKLVSSYGRLCHHAQVESLALILQGANRTGLNNVLPLLLRAAVACAPTLTRLRLGGVSLSHFFSGLGVNLDVKGVLCQCVQLRSLYIGAECSHGSHGSMATLLLALAAGLPRLVSLQWRAGLQTLRPNHLTEELVAALAAAQDTGGLRLLQADNCDFDCVRALPPSLEVLSLSNEAVGLRSELPHLLQRCGGLRELYLLNSQESDDDNEPYLAALGAACPQLRALVVHIPLIDEVFWVRVLDAFAWHSSRAMRVLPKRS